MRKSSRRRDLLEKQYRKGKTVVSVEPFPELDQLVRYRIGLPPSAGDVNGIHTEAARARLSYDDAKGQPVEEWVTAEIIVRKIPMGSRGAACTTAHAVNVMWFRTPKGASSTPTTGFSKLIASNHSGLSQTGKKWSNGVIASLYQKKQEEAAKQQQIIIDFQNKVCRHHQRSRCQPAAWIDAIIPWDEVSFDPRPRSELFAIPPPAQPSS